MSPKKKRKSENQEEEEEEAEAIEKLPKNWWLHSAARRRLLNDLESGTLSLSKEDVSPKEAWERYKNLPEFASVPYPKFVARLNDHRKQVTRDANPNPTGKVRPKNWWKNSAARQRLIDDLEGGRLTLSEEQLGPDEAWEFYRNEPEFVTVAYEKFEDKLREHRLQVSRHKDRSSFEMDALRHDRRLHPRHTHDSQGVPVWDLSEAKPLLKAHIAAGLANMLPNDLRASISPSDLRLTREEYQVFDLRTFTHHIIQEIRLQKYFNYRDDKRTKERITKY
jgi:hypothetical protein